MTKKGRKPGAGTDRVRDVLRFAELARKGMAEVSPFWSWEQSVEDDKRKWALDQMAQKLASLPPEGDGPKPCPKCGKDVRVRARDVSRTLNTINGSLTLRRNAHYCDGCRKGFFPRDIELGLPPDGDMSPDIEARMTDFAVNDPFGQVAERFFFHYGISLSENAFRLVAERVGRRLEEADSRVLQGALRSPKPTPADTLYVQTDGSMVPMQGGAWKEAKVGVVFRSEHHSKGDKTHRGMISEARYVAVVQGPKSFALEMDVAIQLEGSHRAKRVVWLGDGAPSNWKLASTLCPLAIQILDWVHAVENGMKCAKALLGEEDGALPLWKQVLEHHLGNGDVHGLLEQLAECRMLADNAHETKAIDALIRYYRKNIERMRYDVFRAEGLLIGSGVVESAHRHVIQSRMKRAGQHWGPKGARRMARMRAAYRTGGAQSFYRAIHWAHRETSKVPKISRPKRRASNR